MAEIPDHDFDFGELPPSVAKALEGMDEITTGMTPLDTLAIAQHEVWMAFIRAGFRSDQGLYLAASFFLGNPGPAPGDLPD